MISGIDATALAMFAFESGHLNDGTVPAIRNNNPGNLRIPGQTSDDKGFTIFPDFVSGYNALLRDLQAKFSGNNAHGIGPTSSLQAFLNVYAPPSDDNPTTAYATFVANWVAKATGKPITPESNLINIWQSPSNAGDVQQVGAEG